MAELYTVSQSGEYLVSTPLPGDDYDAAVTTEVDRAIRHMPRVVKYVNDMARLLLSRVGDKAGNFEITDATGPARPRFYVKPMTSDGIKAELQHAVLLKAALGMAGK